MTDPLDDITALMGTLPAQEYELRRMIRTARNAASYKVTRVTGPDARSLCWMVTECATFWLYRHAPDATLRKVTEYMEGLLLCVERVEELEALI